MVSHAIETDGFSETGNQPGLRDAEILARALRASVDTSPAAFSRTHEDIDNLGIDYWRKDIASATWAVIQQGDEVVGVAVARRPDLQMDSDIDQNGARFIESVWIAPRLRRRHLGERLMRFLMEAENARNPQVRQFLLWVFDNNDSAITMYKNMGFDPVGQQELHGLVDEGKPRYELKFEYSLDPGSAAMLAAAAERRRDTDQDGLVYRLLGEYS